MCISLSHYYIFLIIIVEDKFFELAGILVLRIVFDPTKEINSYHNKHVMKVCVWAYNYLNVITVH